MRNYNGFGGLSWPITCHTRQFKEKGAATEEGFEAQFGLVLKTSLQVSDCLLRVSNKESSDQIC